MKLTIPQPFVFIVISFSLGIVIGEWVDFSFSYFCLLTGLLVLFIFLILKTPRLSSILLLLLFVCLGGLLTEAHQILSQNDIAHLARFYPKESAEIKGIVASDIENHIFWGNSKTKFILEVKSLQTKWGWQKKTGRILVNVFRDLKVNYGDYLYLEGTMHRPFNFSTETNFSYRDYLQGKGIQLILSVKTTGKVEILDQNKGNPLRAVSLTVKGRLKNILSDNLSKNESGVMQAILLGDRSSISNHIRELFVRTGTAHILAISGLHIGIIAAIFFLFLKMIPIPRKIRFLVTILLLVGYAFLTGCRPSVIRATIMTAVVLAGFIIEREADTLNSLCFAALMILLIHPLNLYDVGFQLSFMSVFSIILLYPRVKSGMIQLFYAPGFRPSDKVFSTERLSQFFIQSLGISTGVWLGVAGLIAYYFNIITPVTVIANLIVVPLISIVVALGIGLLMAGSFVPSCIAVFTLCLKLALNLMVGTIFLFDKIPFAYIYLKDLTLWHVISYYIVILGVFYIPWMNGFRKTKEFIKRS